MPALWFALALPLGSACGGRATSMLDGSGANSACEPGAVVYDVTSEPVLDAEWWTEDDAFRSRGPPCEWDGIDAPAPAE